MFDQGLGLLLVGYRVMISNFTMANKLPLLIEPLPDVPVADKVDYAPIQEKVNQSKKQEMDERKRGVKSPPQYILDSSLDDVGIPLRVRKPGTFSNSFNCIFLKKISPLKYR